MAHRIGLVIGYGETQLARSVAQALLRESDDSRIYGLVKEEHADAARAHAETSLDESELRRLRIVVGDPSAIDFGLPAREVLALLKQVQFVHNFMPLSIGADSSDSARSLLDGAREIVEFAEGARQLAHITQWSSTWVAGNSGKPLREVEYSETDEKHSSVARALGRAETIVGLARAFCPVLIFRCGAIIPDSRTGEGFEDSPIYSLIDWVMNGRGVLRVPPTSTPNARVQMVPVDYAVRAGLQLLRQSRDHVSVFHITDPHAMTATRCIEFLDRCIRREYRFSSNPVFERPVSGLIRSVQGEGAATSHRQLLRTLCDAPEIDASRASALLGAMPLEFPDVSTILERMVEIVRASASAPETRRAYAPASVID